MKRLLFVVVLLPLSNHFYAQVKWDGEAADGKWSSAINWVGDAVPSPADDVFLDNSVVPGSYLVELPGGAANVVIRSLIITPLTGNNITLLLPSTNTSSTAFLANGTGDALVLNNGAIFKNSSGASSGSPVSVTTTNFFRINNGGRYIHNCGRAHTTTLAARLSTAPGTENGTFEFDVPLASFTIAFSNRVYGNLELSSLAKGGSVNYLASGGSIATTAGHLIIHSGVNFSTDITNDILINGNLDQAVSSIFNISSNVGNTTVKIKKNLFSAGLITETGTGQPSIELNGVNHQSVSCTGSIQNVISFKMNNSLGATLLTPLILPHNLELQTGVIKSTMQNILTLQDNQSYLINPSGSAFIDGPFKKIGDDDFIFPIGKQSDYAPVGIYAGSSSQVTDEFIAEYFLSNPATAMGPAFQEPPIDHISVLEWWSVTRGNGTASKKVELTARTYSNATELSDLRIVRWDQENTEWQDEGNSFYSGVSTGPVRSNQVNLWNTSAATYFTFGSVSASTNPLPVKLTAFMVNRVGNNKALLKWEASVFCPNQVKFQIQRSGNGNLFATVGVIQGIEQNQSYSFITDLSKGRNYFRLIITDCNGAVSWSPIVSLAENEKYPIYPLRATVSGDMLAFAIGAQSAEQMEFVVFDLLGRIVQKKSHPVVTGMNSVEMKLANLPKGIYGLSGVGSFGRTNVVWFLRLY